MELTSENVNQAPQIYSCKHCKQEIAQGATICHNCGKYQNLWWILLGPVPVIIPVIVSFVTMFILFGQLKIAKDQVEETRKKRIEAKEILEEVISVREDAESTLANARDALEKSDEVLTVTKNGVALLGNSIRVINQRMDQANESLDKFTQGQEILSREVADTKAKINQINKNFKESQERIEILKESAEKALSEANSAKDMAGLLDEIIIESQQNLELLKDNTEFLGVLLAAQNDDWNALQKLASYADDRSNRFKTLALNAHTKLRADYGGVIQPGFLNITWGDGVDPNAIPLEGIFYNYRHISSELHADLVKLVLNRNDLTKKEKMSFYVEILKTSNSVTAKHYAAKNFTKLVDDENVKWSPFNIDPIINWWNENDAETQ